MICELFPFQKQAVNEMRLRVAMALNNYRMLKIPQVVSLQAPTGSGKTIIMSALIEDIFYGSEQFTEQPDAIFVWLSDSPQLNEQSKQKIEQKADKIRIDQCVVISDESFDREILLIAALDKALHDGGCRTGLASLHTTVCLIDDEVKAVGFPTCRVLNGFPNRVLTRIGMVA